MPNPPKPTRLKILEGNRGRRALNDREPQPPAFAVAPPKWLDAFGRGEWNRLAPSLLGIGLLTDYDVQQYGAYCQAVGDIRKYRRYLKANGETYENAGWVTPRPEMKFLHDAYERLHKFGSAFGFSPAARSRIAMAPKKEDPLDALLG